MNPKDIVGSKKTPLQYVPMNVIFRLGLALMEGALKYGPFNWRKIKVEAMAYIDAANRHIGEFVEGVEWDKESKVRIHNLDKAIASLVVLRDAIACGTWIDNRPPKGPEGWLQELNGEAGKLSPDKPLYPYTWEGLESMTGFVALPDPKKGPCQMVYD